LAGSELGDDRMPVDVRILDHEIAPPGHEGRVELELSEHVIAGVIGIEDHHHAFCIRRQPRDFLAGLVRRRRPSRYVMRS